jgi:hypothetical protein
MDTDEDKSRYGALLQKLANRFGSLQITLELAAMSMAQLLDWRDRYRFTFAFEPRTGKLLGVELPDLSDDPNYALMSDMYEDHREFCVQEYELLRDYLASLRIERGALLAGMAELPPPVHRRLMHCRRGRHWVTLVARYCIAELERWPRLPSREVWRRNISVTRRVPMPDRVDHALEYFAETDPTPVWQKLSRIMDGFIDDLAAVAWGFGTVVDRAPDGPFGVNRWRYQGDVLEGAMTEKPWSLAKYLYERFETKVHVDHLIGPNKLLDDVQPATIQRHASAITSWFVERQVPIVVTSRGQYVWMENSKTEK